MFDWTVLATIAEAVAFAVSILGIVGIGWHVAGWVKDKFFSSD